MNFEAHYKKVLAAWRTDRRSRLAGLEELLDQYCARLQAILEPDRENTATVIDLWRLMDHFNKDILQNLETAFINPQTPELPAWVQEFSAWLDQLQEYYQQHCTKNDTASPMIIQKIARRLTKLDPEAARFLAYCQMITDFVIQEWTAGLQEMDRQSCSIFRMINELNTYLIGVDQLAVVWRKLPTEMLQMGLNMLTKIVKTIREYRHQMDQSSTESTIRLHALTAAREADDGVVPGRYRSLVDIRRASLEQIEELNQTWRGHFECTREEWLKDLELALLQFRTAQTGIQILSQLHQTLWGDLTPIFSEVKKTLARSHRRFAQKEGEASDKLQEDIIREDELLVRKLHDETLPLMVDTVLNAQIEKSLDAYLHQVTSAVNILADHHRLHAEKSARFPLRPASLHEVPLKALVQEEFLPDLSKAHDLFMTSVREDLQEILRSISEFDQIAEFNLEAALNLLIQRRNEPDVVTETTQAVLQGLERTINQIDILLRRVQKIDEQSQQFLLQGSALFIQRLHELSQNDKIMEIEIRLAQARTREQVLKAKQKIWKKFTAFSFKSWIVIPMENLWENFRHRVLRWQKATGLTVSSLGAEDQVYLFLTETQKQIDSLPYVYQRLFRFESLQDERFFISREKELNLLRDDYQQWRQGRRMITAIVGERGSGRTTMLNFAEKHVFTDLPVIRLDLKTTVASLDALLQLLKTAFNLPKIDRLESLEDAILARQRQHIGLVENMQNLFLRIVNGFVALERFLLFISRTNERIHWVVTANLYSWDYLDKVVDIAKFFQRTIYLEGYSQADIAEAINKRHRASGYHLQFIVPEEMKQSARFRKLHTPADQQAFLHQHLLEQLSNLAAGNLMVALLFWVRSIQRVEKNTLVLNPQIDVDFLFLKHLSNEKLFALAALLQHGTLGVAELARIFHQDLDECEHLLTRMINRGLIVQEPDGEFSIHPFLFRPMVQTLKSKNIIH